MVLTNSPLAAHAPIRTADRDTAARLTRSNIIYRQPAIAEEIRAPNAARHTQRWLDLLAQHHPTARSVVDMGCWTGLDTEQLHRHYPRVVGVDIQPHLIERARSHRPGPQFHVGDITRVRLGETFDAILCVGSVLSYVHDDADLDAAFATFAAHAHRGTILIAHTLLAPITTSAPAAPQRVETKGWRATGVDVNEWCPHTHVLTTRRTWRRDDNSIERDVLRRRILPPPELALRARLAGWEVLSMTIDPPEPGTPTVGCMVARFCPPEPPWFWTEQWQAGEREATRARNTGETTVYDSEDDFLFSYGERKPR